MLGKILQEFAAAIEYLTYRAHVNSTEHISIEEARAFAEGVKKEKPEKGGKKALSEALNQVLELKAVDVAAGTVSRLCRGSVRTFCHRTKRLPTTTLPDSRRAVSRPG
jgi:hypothetical protein